MEPGGSQADNFSECKTGADANQNAECRIIGTVNSVQAYWTAELPRYGKQWQPTKSVIYSGATQSQCGTASNQVGPFYCPLDQKVYLDASFFDLLTQKFGADDGAPPRSTSSPTSTATPSRTNSACSAALSRAEPDPTATVCASSSWPTASAARVGQARLHDQRRRRQALPSSR